MEISNRLLLHFLKIIVGLVAIYFLLGAGFDAMICVLGILLTYIYYEVIRFSTKRDATNKKNLNKTIDYSLKTFGKSIIIGIIICCLVSLIGSAIFKVEKINHFFEANEYDAKYIVKYHFGNESSEYNLGVAEISLESYGYEESYYYIHKISDKKKEILFDDACIMSKYKEWFKCDNTTNENKEIWVYITGEKVE